MRVAFVSTGYYPTDSGGGSISTQLIVDELRELGVEVDVYTTTGNHRTLRKIADGHYQLPDGTSYPLPTRVGKNYGIVDHSSEFLDYELIHAYGFGPLPGIIKSTEIPVLGSANNLEWICANWSGYLRAGCPEYGLSEAIQFARQDGYGAFLPIKIGMEAVGKYLSQQSDHYTTQTDGMKTILQRCGYSESNITTVPNLLDSRFDIKPRTYKNQLVYIGRLNEKKGIEEIVRAYVDLPKEIHEQWKFSIYGDGSIKQRIEMLASKADPEIQIQYCPYEDLPEVYREASVLVHGSKYPEPFSRTWLEAMASETAIVCSTNPSSTSVLDGVAEFYDPFDQHSLEKTLTDVLTDPEKRSKMVSEGKRLVEQYRPERVVSEYKRLYERLITDQ